MLRNARNRAGRSGVPFAITADDILIPASCPALGLPLRVCDGVMGDASPSLDRLTPELGYVPGNIVVVSLKANRMKNSGDLEDLRKLVDFYELVLPQRARWRRNPD